MDSGEQKKVNVVGCPFAQMPGTDQVIRRQDLVNLGETFKTSLSPVGKIITHMKRQNERSADLSDHMILQVKRMYLLQFWIYFVLGVCILTIGFHVYNYVHIQRLTVQVGRTVNKLDGVAKAVISVKESAEAVQADVAEVSSVQAASPRVELVPETDPKKAKSAPIRVRVFAPTKEAKALRKQVEPLLPASAEDAHSAQAEAPDTFSAEIPIPAEGLQ